MYLLKGCKSLDIDGDLFILIVHEEVTKCMLSKGNRQHYLYATLEDCLELYDDFRSQGFVSMSLEEMQNLTGIIGVELDIPTSRFKCLVKSVSLFALTYISISYFMRRIK